MTTRIHLSIRSVLTKQIQEKLPRHKNSKFIINLKWLWTVSTQWLRKKIRTWRSREQEPKSSINNLQTMGRKRSIKVVSTMISTHSPNSPQKTQLSLTQRWRARNISPLSSPQSNLLNRSVKPVKSRLSPKMTFYKAKSLINRLMPHRLSSSDDLHESRHPHSSRNGRRPLTKTPLWERKLLSSPKYLSLRQLLYHLAITRQNTLQWLLEKCLKVLIPQNTPQLCSQSSLRQNKNSRSNQLLDHPLGLPKSHLQSHLSGPPHEKSSLKSPLQSLS